MALAIGVAVGAGGDGDDEASPSASAPPEQCSGTGRAGLRALAGQRIVVHTDGTPDASLLRSAERGEIAGVIVFPGPGDSEGRIRAGLRRLQAAASRGDEPPLLVSTDQEGGFVKRFPAGPPLRAPTELAIEPDAGDARLEGRATGDFLAGLGINTDLAPVLDVPSVPDSVIADRAFGEDAGQVSRLGLAFADGLARKNVLATAKHFPGLGRAVLNTDFSPSEVSASRRELSQDLLPFEGAIAQAVPLIMIASASYPELGAKGPAVLEPRIATRLLRTQLGFEGVSISDDLGAEAIAASYDEAEAAQRAAAAGTDLLLFARSGAPGVLERLQRSLAGGALDRDDAVASCARVVELREGLAATGGSASP